MLSLGSHQIQYWWVSVEHVIEELIGFGMLSSNGVPEYALKTIQRMGDGHTVWRHVGAKNIGIFSPSRCQRSQMPC